MACGPEANAVEALREGGYLEPGAVAGAYAALAEHGLAPQVLELIAAGQLDPRPVATQVVSFEEASAALTEGGYTKLIFTP